MNERVARRLGLLGRGYSPLPVKNGGKSPAIRGWSKLEGQINEAIIHSWEEQFPNADGTGIILGHVIGIDIDVDKSAIVDELLDWLAEHLDDDLVVRVGNAPRAMAFARTLTPMKKRKTSRFGSLLNKNQQIEILAKGQFAVTYHIHPETKQPYHWPGIDLLNVNLTELPVISESGIKKFLDDATKIFKRHGLVSEKQHHECEKLALKNQRSKGHDELTAEMIHQMLDAYPNKNLDYDDWIVIGMALQAWGGSKAKELFERWSASSSKNIPEFTAQKFHDCADPHSITVGTLVYKAMQNGYRFPAKHSSAAAINEERPKARIFIHAGKLNESITAVEDAINQSNLDIFRFNGTIIEIVASEDKNSPNEKQILFHTRASLKDRLGVILECLKFSSRIGGWYRTNTPNDLLEGLIERGALSSLPRLKKLADCLYLDEGRVISTEGYNEQTQVFLAREICKPACLKAKPLLASAQASLLELRELFSTFPFKEEADEAVAIAALLALCDSINLDNIPLFGFNAPTAGTGKSLLVDVICGIASGKPAAVMSQGKDEAETEKRLHSALLRGDSIISIDNCEVPLRGDTLCQILTQPALRVRPLGVSKLIDIEKHCCLMATGNNLEVRGDLVRRTLLCKLDANCERPEARQFDRNPFKIALTRRDELVGHCLNIIRAFQAAGAPKQAPSLGSFEKFSSRIRDAMIWSGSVDSVLTQTSLRTNDRRLENEIYLIQWLYQTFDKSRFQVKQINDTVTFDASGDACEMLLNLGVIKNGTIETATLGKMLYKLEGRILGGLKVTRCGSSQNATFWRIIRQN